MPGLIPGCVQGARNAIAAGKHSWLATVRMMSGPGLDDKQQALLKERRAVIWRTSKLGPGDIYCIVGEHRPTQSTAVGADIRTYAFGSDPTVAKHLSASCIYSTSAL